MVKHSFQQLRVELETFRILSLEVEETLQKLVKDGADFLQVTLSRQLVLDSGEEGLGLICFPPAGKKEGAWTGKSSRWRDDHIDR